MAFLHNFATGAGHVLHSIGEKVKQTAEIAGSVKAIWEVGQLVKSALPVAGALAVAL